MGQYALAVVPAELLQRPVSLRDGIGAAHEKVTTASDRAQALYDQGLAYLHSYVWIEAARSFHEALRADSSLAMAHVGLSYALGELGLSEEARRDSDRASELAPNASERERARVVIRSKQLAASAAPGDAARRAEYQAALGGAAAKYPDEVEILLLRGQAAGSASDAHGMSAGAGSIPDYERALALGPDYFAPHHYLAHALENAGRMDAALAHAAEYARLAPRVPHAHHMFGHVLRRVDRMRDAIAEFRRADELETEYLSIESIAPEYDWHYHHNLDLLGASYAYLGRMRAAEPLLRRSFELKSIELSQELNERAWPLFLLGRSRSAEALAAARALAARPQPIVQALGRLLAARAMMALGRTREAINEGDAARDLMRASGAIGGVLVPDLELAQAELLLRTGQMERGRAAMREALAKLRADRAPDAWMQTLFGLESAGRVARDTGDWLLAGELAEEMRRYDPFYAGTHYALGLGAERRSDVAGARAEYAEAIRRWESADAGLAELADARRRVAGLRTAERR
jgi:tetratricopeptide (TPR) repeat protein